MSPNLPVGQDHYCPLCGEWGHRDSWLGSVVFNRREFRYVECLECRSLYCSPMPDAETLGVMYSRDYQRQWPDDPSIVDPKQPERVTAQLRESGTGVFVDFGCGGGRMLERASGLGWRAIGTEFDPAVAAEVEKQTGCSVYVVSDEFFDRHAALADVVHLGDVIEHLTAMVDQMTQVLRLLKPGGRLIAQGPLEANGNLFTQVVKWARRVRRVRPIEAPPYHVLLATGVGQRALFCRLGLIEREFTMVEVSWPAPGRLRRKDLLRPKAIGLFILRRISQMVSALRPQTWGNRYFYVGQVADA